MKPGAMIEQRRPDGSLRHLITLEDLRRDGNRIAAAARAVLCRARSANGRRAANASRGVTIANLFTEPSTRTRVSFELAGRRLGADVVNLEVQLSSRVKGETMLDTIFTLQALHFDVFVIRDAEPGVLALVAANVAPHVSVLSAGEAHLSHPTQGLLDALTIRQYKGPVHRAVDRDRRRHPPFARGAFGLPGLSDARRAKAAHRRAPGTDARSIGVQRLRRASRRSRKDSPGSTWS